MSQFFPTRELTFDQKRDILLRAKEKCDRWWADVLDCSVSFRRQTIDMSFEEIMAKFDDRCHFTIIHRNLDPENFLEIGFRTMDNAADYFLWIILDPKHIPEFTS